MGEPLYKTPWSGNYNRREHTRWIGRYRLSVRGYGPKWSYHIQIGMNGDVVAEAWLKYRTEESAKRAATRAARRLMVADDGR